LRELAGAGLIRRDGEAIVLTAAARCFAWMDGER
jgi:hypothetical protein